MRKIIVITSLLLSLFMAACSKSAGLADRDNGTPASPANNNASNIAWGSGRPATGAMRDVAPAQAKTESTLLPRAGFVNDYANVLDEKTKEDLETSLEKFENDSKIEFVVVTVDTTHGQPSTEYAMAVVRDWGIGSKDQTGGGLILLVAITDRRWSVRWSSNLKTDLEGTEDELEALMTVPFRQGNYSRGIAKGVKTVMSKLANRRTISPPK